MEPHKIRRRDEWRALGHGWQGRLRSTGVLLVVGLAMLSAAAWWYGESSAFARRSVVTGAVIETVHTPHRLEREDGPPVFIVRGVVRYTVAGRDVRARVRLRNCRTAECIAAVKRGDRLTIAYDPQAESRAKVAPARGLSAAPNEAMLVLAGVGVLFLVIGAYTLAFGEER